jgi:hypothetical protein
MGRIALLSVPESLVLAGIFVPQRVGRSLQGSPSAWDWASTAYR